MRHSFSPIKRLFQRILPAFCIALLVSFLATQAFAGMHATEHALDTQHDHCSICLTATHLGNGIPAVSPILPIITKYQEIPYFFALSTTASFNVTMGYTARAPPIL